jgi:hypothetical protein
MSCICLRIFFLPEDGYRRYPKHIGVLSQFKQSVRFTGDKLGYVYKLDRRYTTIRGIDLSFLNTKGNFSSLQLHKNYSAP